MAQSRVTQVQVDLTFTETMTWSDILLPVITQLCRNERPKYMHRRINAKRARRRCALPVWQGQLNTQKRSFEISQNICVPTSSPHTHTHTETQTLNHSRFLWWNKRLSFVPATRRERLHLWNPPDSPLLRPQQRLHRPLTCPQLLCCTFKYNFLPSLNAAGHPVFNPDEHLCEVWSNAAPLKAWQLWQKRWGNYVKKEQFIASERKEAEWDCRSLMMMNRPVD